MCRKSYFYRVCLQIMAIFLQIECLFSACNYSKTVSYMEECKGPTLNKTWTTKYMDDVSVLWLFVLLSSFAFSWLWQKMLCLFLCAWRLSCVVFAFSKETATTHRLYELCLWLSMWMSPVAVLSQPNRCVVSTPYLFLYQIVSVCFELLDFAECHPSHKVDTRATKEKSRFACES